MNPRECSFADISGRSLQDLSPGITLNQILQTDQRCDHFGCMNSSSFGQNFSHRVGQTSQELCQPATAVQHQCVNQGDGPCGTTGLQLAETGAEDRHWRWDTHQCGAAGATDRNPAADEEKCKFENVLEHSLLLKADDDDEWQQMVPFRAHPQHCLYNYGDALCSFNTFRMPQQPYHCPALWEQPRPWADSHSWFCSQDNVGSSSLARGNVSINVPQIILPGDMSQVRVMNLRSGGAEMSPRTQNRRIISLPEACKKVFVTYSLDSASEVVPFVNFLTWHGFQAAIDTFDSPVGCVDRYLVDPSTLIIIAISPKYKEDVEGVGVGAHSLHTRYIYTTMQNQFILQGSLNFRFIPVRFLNASQKHVPSWLQNTRVYQWPQEMEDLLLGLLRVEKYAPPPVPTDLTLTMRPVAPTFVDTP